MKNLFVGLESAIDVWAKLESLGDLLELSRKTRSGLSEELELAYGMLRENKGDEIPVDGKDTSILIDELKRIAKIENSIGGSAAIETSQFLALGANPSYLGNYYPHQIEGSLFSKANFSLAKPSDFNPLTIILQTTGDRFILSNGVGRRISYLLDYIISLPDRIGASLAVDAFSLVGWHVLFGLGVGKNDVDSVVLAIKRMREYGRPMFSDTGGFGRKSDREIRLLWKIYELFDILSLNQREFQKICNAFSIEGSDEQKLNSLLELGQNLHTIWLHTREHQMCVSHQFEPQKVALAQEFSSAAGCLRVETGKFSSTSEIESRNIPGRSVLFKNGARTSSLKSRNFKTEVGAGDVSAASFLWNLLS